MRARYSRKRILCRVGAACGHRDVSIRRSVTMEVRYTRGSAGGKRLFVWINVVSRQENVFSRTLSVTALQGKLRAQTRFKSLNKVTAQIEGLNVN